jgi:hypothetical protein
MSIGPQRVDGRVDLADTVVGDGPSSASPSTQLALYPGSRPPLRLGLEAFLQPLEERVEVLECDI